MKTLATILGAGESGIGAALLAKSKDFKVFVSDIRTITKNVKKLFIQNNIDFEENKHTINKILKSSLVIKSPGISDSLPIIRKIEMKNIPIIDEIEFASQFTNAKIIAITGTNGKTTVSLLVYHILKNAGINVGLAGNIGYSLAKQIISDKKDYYVVEISSFQLDRCYTFKPFISLLLNITNDHLDRYDYNISEYINSKFRIIQNSSIHDYFLYNESDSTIREKLKTLALDNNCKTIAISSATSIDGTITINSALKFNQKETNLIGNHNAQNIKFSIQVANILKIDPNNILSGIKSFKNAPHRMEFVENINEVIYINDSKATNVISTFYALNSIKTNIIWIAGGIDKGNDYQYILKEIKSKVKTLICLGKDIEKLKSSFINHVEKVIAVDNMNSAVNEAAKNSQKGNVVLLSPACSSFDLFKNYEDRGENFKKEVIKLKNQHSPNKLIKCLL